MLHSYLEEGVWGYMEVAQGLGALASLEEGLGLTLNSHTAARNHL